jgi:hypothetical protein
VVLVHLEILLEYVNVLKINKLSAKKGKEENHMGNQYP